MAHCPHCNVHYDETNETQPCCYQCGHPISCGCGGGHSHSPSPSAPPSIVEDVQKETPDRDEDSPKDEAGTEESEGEAFSPGEGLPF